MRTLEINGIEIPLKASHQLQQDYEPVQGVNRVRYMNGGLAQQTAWSGKTLTSISGVGNIPAGLQLIDYTNAITIKCMAERVVTSASNVISVPSARRADYGVEGRALLDGVWQSTPVSVGGDTATLTVVVGATAYQAIYWPEIVCFADPPTENRNLRTSDYSWSITAEEV